jgi:hypothetical protein
MSKIKKSATDPAGAGHALKDYEIDLGAAIPAQPAKPKRGRPRTAAPKPINPNRKVRKDKGIKKTKPQSTTAPYIDNNIYNKIGNVGDIDNSDNQETRSVTKLKDKMTEKELRFIGLYLTGEHSKEKAMILAGYDNISQDWRYNLAQRIVQKYESQAGDHRIIARAMGAGEVLVFKTLLELMRSKNERIRLDATVNLAKILGLTKEQVEGGGGLTIIFEGADQRQVHLPGPTEQEPTTLPTHTRPLQITK